MASETHPPEYSTENGKDTEPGDKDQPPIGINHITVTPEKNPN